METGDDEAAHLRPKTFTITKGAIPLHVAASSVNGIVNRPTRWEAMKRMTAITNCANKKNSGASVEFKTHLFL